MANVSATEIELDTFLGVYGFAVAGDKQVLLARSIAFLNTLEFCKEPDHKLFKDAQGFLVTAIENGLDLFATADSKTLVERGLGRNAIVKKWQVDETLSGTDSLSKLKAIPQVYNMLAPYLCGYVDPTQANTPCPAVYVV